MINNHHMDYHFSILPLFIKFLEYISISKFPKYTTISLSFQIILQFLISLPILKKLTLTVSYIKSLFKLSKHIILKSKS